MPDFRVADTAPEHPKLRAAGLAAVGLWAAAGGYSMRELTDGWVPDYWVQTWPAGRKQATTLVKVGLWVREQRNGMPGYSFHDWTDYQRPAQRFAEEREQNRERARRHRQRTGRVTRDATRDSDRDATRDVTRDERNSYGNVTQAPSPSPSPLPRDGQVGGEASGTERGRPGDGPPPNIDPENPRCVEHADIPAGERGPDCAACGRVRRVVERQAADRVAAELADRQARRAAIDACDRCDERGMRELDDDRVARCRHDQPDERRAAS